MLSVWVRVSVVREGVRACWVRWVGTANNSRAQRRVVCGQLVSVFFQFSSSSYWRFFVILKFIH